MIAGEVSLAGLMAMAMTIRDEHGKLPSGLRKRGDRESTAVMAMAISYNWLFLWDFLHSINGVM